MHEDWTVGGFEAGGGSHRVVKKMLEGASRLVCFWDQSCMKDVVMFCFLGVLRYDKISIKDAGEIQTVLMVLNLWRR